jgi:IclR family transcriptional regulator, KDG regulon repressor
MSLERDLALLEVLAGPEGRRRGALGVTRIAAMAGMDKGQVSRALRALESEAVVERDPETLEYRMGWRLRGSPLCGPTRWPTTCAAGSR